MGYELSWLDDGQSITLLRILQPWDWPEFDECLRRSHDMARSKGHVVDAIIVMGDDFKPPDANLLTHARSLYADIPPNTGMTVVVGASRFVKAVIGIITGAVGNKAHPACVNTIEEARALIVQRRKKVEQLKVHS